jgi:hypothetical protein
MIAGGRTDHTSLELVGGEMRDLVVGAAQLEGKDRLQIFAFQQDTIADACRQAGAGSSGVSIATSYTCALRILSR